MKFPPSIQKVQFNYQPDVYGVKYFSSKLGKSVFIVFKRMPIFIYGYRSSSNRVHRIESVHQAAYSAQ